MYKLAAISLVFALTSIVSAVPIAESELNLQARSNIAAKMIGLMTHGPSRRVITQSVNDNIKHGVKQPDNGQPSSAQKAFLAHRKNLQDQKKQKRSLETRSSVIKSMIGVMKDGASRRVVTSPLRDSAQTTIRNSKANGGQPSSAQKLLRENRQKLEQKYKKQKRSLEARASVFKSMFKVMKDGPSRRVVTSPVRDSIQKNSKSNGAQSTSAQKLLRENRQKLEQKYRKH